jgi:hypothetical protein
MDHFGLPEGRHESSMLKRLLSSSLQSQPPSKKPSTSRGGGGGGVSNGASAPISFEIHHKDPVNPNQNTLIYSNVIENRHHQQHQQMQQYTYPPVVASSSNTIHVNETANLDTLRGAIDELNSMQ